ncbi:MAG: hypothetical protein ACRDKU_09890 [Gaiellaceae bacterium]
MRVALDAQFGEQTITRNVGKGRFRLVGRASDRIEITRPGLTVVFHRMDPFAATRAFARGELDEAPVPQGEIRAVEAHPVLGPTLRGRELRGLDVVVFPPRLPDSLLRAYRLTAPRGDYQQLISERVACPAYGLRPDAKRSSPADFRRARASIRTVPRIPLALGIPELPELAEAAELAWAEWRQLGLPIRLVPEASDPDARFVRMVPPMRAERENVVALGWVAEARLVSPRVRGWRMNALGLVDYTRVTLEPRP